MNPLLVIMNLKIRYNRRIILNILAYLKLEIRVVCREFLAFKYVFIVFFETNQMIINICTSEILLFKQVSVYNNNLNLFWRYRLLNGYCVVEKQVLNV